ncbi:MAG: hypothetical protein M3268_07015, partial [Acidobacteriota bacterium]|nr:hypothetical protein [Acidobacteriota bacterium]
MAKHKGAITFIFAATLFAGAALLFWVEPMVAKMLLPLLGGTPAVWNTCLLFFQSMLLAGYAYALFASRRLTLRQQLTAQAIIFIVAALSIPIRVPASVAAGVPRGGNPSLWLLGRLLLVVGLPFFALSTLTPLLQRWFAATRARSARDPYFLYAASNAGSLCALLAYPLALEPLFTLRRQSSLWAFSYAALTLLVATCGALALISTPDDSRVPDDGDARRGATARADEAGDEMASDDEAALTNSRRALWVLLAFVPSSLMIGVTTYVSTDIASIPLLWVVPLSLYLVTLIIAFARGRANRRRRMGLFVPGVALVFLLAYLSGATQPVWFLVAIHLLFFFVAALMCHTRLADDRPSASHLAEFYLWLAAGGALGGLFNAIVAPLVFDRVVEYPLAVVAACALVPRRAPPSNDEARSRWLDLGYGAALGLLTVLLALLVARANWSSLGVEWTTQE